uniref:ATP-dependent DNA helicase UvrD/PcrA n=1 Tax=Klebsiella pneumoniae TaxID=573 RepID=A0A8B0SSU7_KLEPN|nr:ATP-dependent DNA helicase UvrD/PcrA [Klebsiella pneumoniae]
MTRAELELYITRHGKPSEFITESFPKVVELAEEIPIIEGSEDMCLQ